MAESSCEEKRLKCKKCRETLVKNPPNDFRESTEQEEEGNIYSLDEDSCPEWVNNLVQQAGWTKGKLICPSCRQRVGGFDFVSGSAEPIHIVKSKVDIWSSVPVAVLVQPPTVLATASGGSGVQTVVTPASSRLQPPGTSGALSQTSGYSAFDSQTRDTIATTNPVDITGTDPSPLSSALTISVLTAVDSSADGGSEDSDDESTSASTNHTDDESSSLDSDGHASRSRRHREKTRRRRRRRAREKKRRVEKRSAHDRVEAKVRELLEAEPELGDLPDELVCPVCLDLLHEPFQTEPCHHIFCEPCLRRLGQKNPMNTKCPLCRTRIRFCKHLAATSREIREDHEALYLRRKKFERSTPVYSYPLPWTPGWRNLIRGRPLGGNRLLVENNHAEYIRTILHQIPYYIPPVMFANLINILLFGFLIGFVELLPSLLYALFGGGKTDTSPNNLTEVVPEISGSAEPILEEDESSMQPLEEIPAVVDGIGPEALDSTFYFILFLLSIIAAGIGHFLINQEQGQPFGYRLTDMCLMICLSSLPLLVVPTLRTYRAQEGSYVQALLKKLTQLIPWQFSFHTFVLAIVLAGFLYLCDGADEMFQA